MSVPKKSGGIYSWQRIQTAQTKIHFHLVQMSRTETQTRKRQLRIRTVIKVLIRTAAIVLTRTHTTNLTTTKQQENLVQQRL